MREIIHQKIAIFTNQPPANIRDDSVLTDLVPESFLLVELVIELQEELGVQLMQEDLKDVKTVGDLVAVVEKKQRL